jgi:hypothetical protein
MTQTTARHDPHANPEDDAVYPQASHPEHKQDARARQPVAQPPGDGPVSADEPDEPDEHEFHLIGEDDLSPADLGPAAPNATDPDRDSGRPRKITR